MDRCLFVAGCRVCALLTSAKNLDMYRQALIEHNLSDCSALYNVTELVEANRQAAELLEGRTGCYILVDSVTYQLSEIVAASGRLAIEAMLVGLENFSHTSDNHLCLVMMA